MEVNNGKKYDSMEKIENKVIQKWWIYYKGEAVRTFWF